MPRRARLCMPALLYHLVQRGNSRETCFSRARQLPILALRIYKYAVTGLNFKPLYG
jgi:REP element-mobilizing transposase RayT